ncbi:MAG TPA: basic secretory protein-like protein [Verrucomicrobiae bacterium]|nr:basic secretory protein-like protein [Verrucomicrobiae bacterium]
MTLRWLVRVAFVLGSFAGATWAESVRNVDFGDAPEMKEMAEHVRRFGNEMYPKILGLLVEDPLRVPARFDVTFKKGLKSGRTGTTKNTRIDLDAREYMETADKREWYARNATNLDAFAEGATNLQMVLIRNLNKILVHEMAHVAQQYRGMAPIYWTKAPTYWEEGIAEYVRFKLGYTNAWDCPQCSAAFPHYTSGYECAGAFLLHVDATYGSNVVRRLNTKLRQGSYSDSFFAETTGRNLDDLWTEFGQTPAVKPVAVELNKFRAVVGYRNGKPPRNIRARAAAYLQQHAEVRSFYEALGFAAGKPHKHVQSAIEAYLYLKLLPGGDLTLDAMRVLAGLRLKGQLPGWSKSEHGRVSFALSNPDKADRAAYPVSRTLLFNKKNGDITYHYTVIRLSEDDGWKLHRAWRTGSDGRIIEEYPVR